jgi:hypothetical protein
MGRKRAFVYHGNCPACGKKCEGHKEDFGIGAYEYWGARGTHHDYRIVSDCCEEEMTDVSSDELEPDDTVD